MHLFSCSVFNLFWVVRCQLHDLFGSAVPVMNWEGFCAPRAQCFAHKAASSKFLRRTNGAGESFFSCGTQPFFLNLKNPCVGNETIPIFEGTSGIRSWEKEDVPVVSERKCMWILKPQILCLWRLTWNRNLYWVFSMDILYSYTFKADRRHKHCSQEHICSTESDSIKQVTQRVWAIPRFYWRAAVTVCSSCSGDVGNLNLTE